MPDATNVKSYGQEPAAAPASQPEAMREAVGEEPYPPARYAWYVVGVLTLALIFSFIDRIIIALLVEPIRRDLGISDTRISLLIGFSFAIFYTFCGIPLGRLADSWNRRTLIAIGFMLWSLMTAGCGLATSYTQMLLFRMGVGVGEATLSPSAYSLIADYFPPRRRATAFGVYAMAIYLGSGLAFFIGGVAIALTSSRQAWSLPLLGEVRPWQVVFFVVGLPGVAAALLLYTVREPVRRGAKMIRTSAGTLVAVQVPLREVFDYLRRNGRTILCHNLGFAMFTLSGYAGSAWLPSYFLRAHGWSAPKVGMIFGLTHALAGALGVVAGGRFADWLAARGYRDANLRVGIISALSWLPAGILVPLVPDANLAAVLSAPASFCAALHAGAAAAAIQQIMPNPMRGQAGAIYLFAINLIGPGLGPTAVAVLTDYVFRNEQSVNYSILIVTVGAHLAGAVLLWAGLKPFLRSLDCVEEWVRTNTKVQEGNRS